MMKIDNKGREGMKWNEMKWNEMKWNEMKWNEFRNNHQNLIECNTSRREERNKEYSYALSSLHFLHHLFMGQICEDIFMRAEELAKKSTMLHRHGAVIVRGNMIIGEGHNQRSTYLSHNYSMHAEIAAIHSIPRKNRNRKYLEDSTMVVIRVAGQDNHSALSAPCANCRKEIQKLGIRRIFYSQWGRKRKRG